MNSFKFMEQALSYEIKRQIELLERGERIEQETRGWDEKSGTTVSQRSKEGSVDYRYFPEPDLPPIFVDKEKMNSFTAELPLMPAELRLKAEEFGLPYPRVSELQDLDKLAEFIDTMTDNATLDPVLTANWVTKPFAGSAVFRAFLLTVMDHKLSGTAAQKLYDAVQKTGKAPADLVSGLSTVDRGELEEMIKVVLADNSEIVEKIKAGDNRALGYLMGQIMAKSKGAAEPTVAKEILERLLGE